MTLDVLKQRLSGIILHPTSLPNQNSPGTLGVNAYKWVDWLHHAGFRIWQILPLTPVADGSPYNSFSAFAGNADLIDIPQLQYQGFPELDDPQTPQPYFEWFRQAKNHGLQNEYNKFLEQSPWLEDFCLFITLKQHFQSSWLDWPEELKYRDKKALKIWKQDHHKEFAYQQFLQFLFFIQWQGIKQHANNKGIYILGDLPIFVAHDSADVWANPELFKLQKCGTPTVIAGVPPDYFSETGQRWGNPIYQWQYHVDTDFSWWRNRINHSLTLYNTIRIDHFRGFVACWEIPANEPTAINGTWVNAPGDQLFHSLLKERDTLPLVAEDLGIITRDVIKLREKYELPGMKILQFAFDSDGKNPYLPHNHTKDSIIYTGTHDNNTTVGWFSSLDVKTQNNLMEYLAHPKEPMPWPLIKTAMASPANWAILPFQDLLELGEQHRMNIPGTTEGNWQWQFQWQQVESSLAERMKSLNQLYNR